ncbi:MAG: protease modulator HflC [Deltaproteobacteria bacterium]|nr:protease modulator HflC [Deltaproteobacteria bacterium]
MRPSPVLLALGAVIGLGAASVFTLDAREVAVVTAFGAPVRTLTEPGMYARWPWPLQEVVRFDARARVLDAPPTEVLTGDKKNLVVEVFAIWRVEDPRRFLEALGSVEAAEAQLVDLVSSRAGAAIGALPFADLLATQSPERGLLPPGVAEGVAATASSRLGVAVIDVRLRHVGLPLQNEQSIYERMRAERQRIASQYRSEGEEQAQGIRARADREAAEILAAAEAEAALVRAEAEREAARRYAEAYRTDPGLYELLVSLDGYREVLGEKSVLVLDSQGEFFDVLNGAPR